MKRRTFISTTFTALSAAALSQSVVYGQSTPSQPKDLVEKFIYTFQFDSTVDHWSDSSFNQLYTETSKSFQKSAYRLLDTRTYALTKSDLVMVPMELTITVWVILIWNHGILCHLRCGRHFWERVQKVCSNVANNTTTVPGSAIGSFQAQSATATHEILLQGAGPNVAGNWSGNANTPVPGITSQSGAGVFTFGATCLILANPLP